MNDKPGLPPITLPTGKRTEGTLLSVPVSRIAPKSAFLRKLEKVQRPKKVDNVTPIKKQDRTVR